jgi:hypothetical protein
MIRRSTIKVLVLAAAVFTAASLLSACATVQPWQRGRLADRCMTFNADGAMAEFAAHWQAAREAASGGAGIQSGGCGCK